MDICFQSLLCICVISMRVADKCISIDVSSLMVRFEPRISSVGSDRSTNEPQPRPTMCHEHKIVFFNASYLQHCRALVDCGLVPVLLNGLLSNDGRFVESCLCCLRTLFSHCTDPPIDSLYADINVIPHLIALMPLSTANQISVSTVLTHACKTREQQNILAGHGTVRALAGLLASPHADVQLPALKCLAFMVFGNEQVRVTVDALAPRKSP